MPIVINNIFFLIYLEGLSELKEQFLKVVSIDVVEIAEALIRLGEIALELIS